MWGRFLFLTKEGAKPTICQGRGSLRTRFQGEPLQAPGCLSLKIELQQRKCKYTMVMQAAAQGVMKTPPFATPLAPTSQCLVTAEQLGPSKPGRCST
jgi:hypothetical protein